MSNVRRGTEDDVGAVAAMLARAFFEDPVAGFIFPDLAGRGSGLERFFALQMRRNYLSRGELWVEESRAGAALWLPPDARPPGASELLALGSLLAILRGRFLLARRLALVLAARHPRTRHYYLGTIGTDPQHQHSGVGSALLSPVLHRCDLGRIPAYLECSREENIAFYKANGFEVVDEVGGDGRLPSLWLMWREPRPPPDQAPDREGRD